MTSFLPQFKNHHKLPYCLLILLVVSFSLAVWNFNLPAVQAQQGRSEDRPGDLSPGASAAVSDVEAAFGYNPDTINNTPAATAEARQAAATAPASDTTPPNSQDLTGIAKYVAKFIGWLASLVRAQPNKIKIKLASQPIKLATYLAMPV